MQSPFNSALIVMLYFIILGLPYFVERTETGKCLPVYTDYRHAGNQQRTIIRRIYGNVDSLVNDLKGAMPEGRIEGRPDIGQVIIKGNYSTEVKQWLANKGF